MIVKLLGSRPSPKVASKDPSPVDASKDLRDTCKILLLIKELQF